jgi:hypothetical protein
MATQPRTNSFERKAGLNSDDVGIEGGEVDVSVGRGQTGDILMNQVEISTDKVLSAGDLGFEAFMAQELEVQMSDSGGEDENQYAEITVNGDRRCIRRGDIGFLKRYHVEVLAQGKEMRLKQVKVVNPDGSMGYEEKMVPKVTYPFTVIHDPAGKRGSDWLRLQLRNAR